MDVAIRLIPIVRSFPPDERFVLCDQLRRSSRSVCSNIAEAWRKRRYPAHFIAKLSDAEGEAAESQVSLEFAWREGYINQTQFEDLFDRYDKVLAQLVLTAAHADKWKTPRRP
jgi:four helix bundle protein